MAGTWDTEGDSVITAENRMYTFTSITAPTIHCPKCGDHQNGTLTFFDMNDDGPRPKYCLRCYEAWIAQNVPQVTTD